MARTKIPKAMSKAFSAMHRGVYKLSSGRIGGSFGASKVILITTTGRKSGKKRTLPLIGVDHGDGWGIIASASGHDTHPAWYLNLKANPEATVTVGKTEHSVVARILEGEERQQVWDQAVEANPDYAEYQKVTDRVIPVLALEPA